VKNLLKANPSHLRTCLTVAALLLFVLSAFAHPGRPDLSGVPRTQIASIYLELGFTHIIPLGVDHILFVVCLYLLNPKLKSVIWQATAFTVAHSITLGLAMYGYISPPSHIVEPLIALSIFFVAVENILTDKLKPTRLLIVFVFGLLHGMGFAGVLTELGLPDNEFVTALITFNVGVELGQITVILACWALVGVWFSKKSWYKNRVVIPVSAIIGLIAIYWTIERTFWG
jgi:hydrogenase/urease accessory protein HupE